MYADLFLPRLRLLRYCLRLTLPSWLGVTRPTSRATATLSPTTSMPTHTDCTFSTSTDTWRRGRNINIIIFCVCKLCFSLQGFYTFYIQNPPHIFLLLFFTVRGITVYETRYRTISMWSILSSRIYFQDIFQTYFLTFQSFVILLYLWWGRRCSGTSR